MSLREQIKAKCADMRRTRSVEIPEFGLTVLAVGLMLGERNRYIDTSRDAEGKVVHSKALPLALAMGIYDPETRKPLWNPNNLKDKQEIDELPGPVADRLFNVVMELSGVDVEKAAGESEEGEGAEGNGEGSQEIASSSSC